MPKTRTPPESHRLCKACGETKPIDEFPFSSASLYRRRECKPCYSAKQLPKVMAAYHANREAIAEKRRTWRAEQKALGIKPKPRVRQDNERYKQMKRSADIRRLEALRLETFGAYGGAWCSCCGERELVFLSLDHVNGDGNKERSETGTRGGHRFYKWLKERGFPPGYQVLCMNCNCGRHRNGGICPHQQQRDG